MEKILSGIKPKFVEIMPGLDEIDKNIALLSSFLHDIGKGSKKDHSEVGEELAERIGKRLGLAGESLNRLKFIVRNHLILPHFSQRRDLHERETLEKLASSFPDHITLNTLYLVSIADALATNPNNWNHWKAHLLGEIYGKVDDEMRKGLGYVEEEHVDVDILREELSQIFPQDLVSSYISSLSYKFISFFNYDRLFRYSYLLLKAYVDKKGVATYTVRKEGVIEIVAIDKDTWSLISECAGLLFISGFNILSLYSEGGVLGLSINVFWVQPQDKTKAQNFIRMFKNRNLDEIIEQVRRKREKFTGKQFGIKRNSKDSVRVIFDNTTSQNYTIVEVYCYDRPGLLFDISCAISFMGYEISVAKISTREDKVADIFYIRDRTTGKKLQDDQCKALKDSIRNAIIQGIQIQLGQRQFL
jgi:[protein-PII] uridylyltransferase